MTEALDWLLEDEAPGVAYRTRRDLLGESPSSSRMRALARRRNDYPPVAEMLERAGEALAAGLYKKYQGFGWTLIFLAEMECDGGDRRAAELAEAVLAAQLDSGGFAPRGSAVWEIVCLTANLLRALVHLGYGAEPAVARGYQRLVGRILDSGGVPCRVIEEHTARASCRMTIPQTLRALGAAPRGVDDEAVAATADLLVEQLKEMRVYRYMRPDVGHYQEVVRLRPRGERRDGESVEAFKSRYRAEHPVTPEEWVEKPSWLRFGFPVMYNPDLLEGLLALAEIGVPADPAYDEALDVVESKRGDDGRWRLERSLNGKMLSRVEKKGRPSKWITLKALTVLHHFGRIGS